MSIAKSEKDFLIEDITSQINDKINQIDMQDGVSLTSSAFEKAAEEIIAELGIADDIQQYQTLEVEIEATEQSLKALRNSKDDVVKRIEQQITVSAGGIREQPTRWNRNVYRAVGWRKELDERSAVRVDQLLARGDFGNTGVKIAELRELRSKCQRGIMMITSRVALRELIDEYQALIEGPGKK